MPPPMYTPSQAAGKIRQYCAYQERCHSEVRDKLYSYGLNSGEVEELLTVLITENYLSEERFARQFAGGKFRMKQWGRMKIRQALRLRQVSEACILSGLKEIDDRQYEKAFQKLVEGKLKTLKSEKNSFVKKRKLQDFLQSRGFETDMIAAALRTL